MSIGSQIEPNRNYRQIFKSTSLVGGAQVANILIGIARTKVLAVLLGPTGMGLVGMYQSTTWLIGTLTGFGIGQAGVREIAEAKSTEDKDKIAKTVLTLRRVSIVSGLLGMIILIILSRPITQATFGNLKYINGVVLISLSLFFSSVTAGQTALLQGLRHLKELAACTVLGSLFGTLASILIVYFFHEEGVALFLVSVAALSALPSWWFARRIQVQKLKLSAKQLLSEAKGLFRMGLAFMVSGLLAAVTAYIIRVLITRELGIYAVGLYTATWTLSLLYVGIILNAMGADYYPRLTAVADNSQEINKMVNDQTEMGLLMSLPGILFTMVLAPLILDLFYSDKFLPATELIRWQILGIALRVISWPLGYVLLAKGRSGLFMLAECAAAFLQIIMTVLCVRTMGLEGIGLAFMLMYMGYTVVIFIVVHRLTCFQWSKESMRLIIFGLTNCFIIFMVVRFLSKEIALFVGLTLSLSVSVICIFLLNRLLGINIFSELKRRVRGILK